MADREGFIVVYPQGTGFPQLWSGLDFDSQLKEETIFFNDLIDERSAELYIYATRIFINGYSNGVAMTFRLFCTISHRVAAFGMVALPGFEEWFTGWGTRSQYEARPEIERFAPDVVQTEYINCAQGVGTTLYTLQGAGHIWPGGIKFAGDVMGPYTNSINATETMWHFFNLQPKQFSEL